MPSDPHARDLKSSLAWFNAISFGLVFGGMVGLGIFTATLVLVIKGGPDVGRNLGLLREFVPGYSVSFLGAFIGFLWAQVLFCLLAIPAAWLYYRSVLRHIAVTRKAVGDEALLNTVARIRIPGFAVACGLFCGSVILIATLWLILTHRPGTKLGPHMALLAHYLPGYSVSIGGAVIGFVEGLVFGAIAFASVAWIYDRLTLDRNAGRAA
jgi:hypothetical protein